MNENTLNLRFISDGGHGWLIVTDRDLALVNLSTRDFSDFSYALTKDQGTKFALEEDRDAMVFIKRAEGQGLTLNITERHTDFSLIRQWESIRSVEVQA